MDEILIILYPLNLLIYVVIKMSILSHGSLSIKFLKELYF